MKTKMMIFLPLLLLSGCGTSTQDDTQNFITATPEKPKIIGEERQLEPLYEKPLKTSRAFTTSEQDQIRSDGLAYLNVLRQHAGMITYSSQSNLNTSAYNHAHYLMLNNAIGHGESSLGDGFTGAGPSDRAVYAGYLHRKVGENLSSGNDSVYDSIDGLFSAIYHRFGFLDFTFDEIGIGADSSASHPHGNAYNYNMGLSQLSDLCGGTSYDGSGSYYTGVCADTSFKIEASAYENAISENKNLNPEYVVWPYPNQPDARPVFFEEDPDPLPDCSVSGYPVSIQFNPAKTGIIDIQDIRLYYENNNSEITNTRLLDNDTDPNGRFTTKEAALYSLLRLDWDTRYKATVDYTEDGVAKTISWNFKTKSLPHPYYIVQSANSSFNIKSGQTYLFYLPPSDCNDSGAGYSMSYSGGLTIENSFYDYNTIQLKVTGESGTVNVSPNNGRDFSLTISNTDSAIYPKNKTEYDFDGDGKSDIFWRNKTTGQNFIYLMNGIAIQSGALLNTVSNLDWETQPLML